MSVIIEQDDGWYHISPGSSHLIHAFKHTGIDFFDFCKRLRVLGRDGVTEIVMVESQGWKGGMGNMGWYNCQSMCRDIAKVDTGFIINPWHLHKKLMHSRMNYTVINRTVLKD